MIADLHALIKTWRWEHMHVKELFMLNTFKYRKRYFMLICTSEYIQKRTLFHAGWYSQIYISQLRLTYHSTTLFFLLYINDISDVIKNSKILLYANDITLYRVINYACDVALPQQT